jgi:glutathione synthase/RimK-type ligase-like ATP-grasp enzyme
VSARVAYLTGRAWRGAPLGETELPSLEAPDFALIAKASAARGLQFEVRQWDDASLPEAGFAAAVVRSCWDYTERREEFVARMAAHEEAGLRLFNSAAAVAWNSRKTYLDSLGELSIPTRWCDVLDAEQVARAFDAFDAADLVVKPQVGAGSGHTIRLRRNGWSEADLRDGPPGPAMLQPYLRSIESEGERSLIWVGGAFAFAVRKVPHAGRWFANQPGLTNVFAEAPPAAARAAAEAALSFAPKDLLFVRVDVVRAESGEWRVIEIEAIEPYLYLGFAPEAAGIFVDALSRVLSR